jgi:hypothetical protein
MEYKHDMHCSCDHCEETTSRVCGYLLGVEKILMRELSRTEYEWAIGRYLDKESAAGTARILDNGSNGVALVETVK